MKPVVSFKLKMINTGRKPNFITKFVIVFLFNVDLAQICSWSQFDTA